MLTRLYLKNFRAFSELNIPLTKINLFFGPNNSGKSAILSAINLLSQTIQSADPEVPLLLDGKYEDLGTYEDIIYNNEFENDLRLSIEFQVPGDVQNNYYPLRRTLFSNTARMNIEYHYRKQRRQTVINALELSSPPGNVLIRTRVAKVSNNQLIDKIDPSITNIPVGPISSGIIRLNHYVPYVFPATNIGRKRFSRKLFLKYRNLDYNLILFQQMLTAELENVQFIGPFRSSPLRIYTFSGESPSYVGPHGEKTIDILASDESRRMGKKRGTLQYISEWFKRSRIARIVEIEPMTERHFRVLVTHYETGEVVNLADAGYGCSQILPILVAGYNIPSNSKFIVEQPEIHLHPSAEAEVGTFLYEVSKRNIQIFVETHSEHLLLRLQSHIAAKELNPSDINIFYVYSKEGKKICQKIPLANDGYFAEDWPRGFFPERLEEAKKIAKYST